MNFNQYEKEFRRLALDARYSEANIIKCLDYAKLLIENNLPVIYNTENLAALVGYKRSYIKRAVYSTEYFYRKFTINKRNGNPRTISEPLPSLKEIQIWILENVLYNIPVSRFAKAYVPSNNILDNVKFHKRQKKVLCIDVKDFFSSIKRIKVEEIFINAGYSKRVAGTLGLICCLNDCLPQGAPTSPYLSNIFMINFDKQISNYCLERKIRYTRYSDDLTFSGDFDEKLIIDFVDTKLNEIELKINKDKIRLRLQNQRQIVTGIVVNEKLQVPKMQRKKFRQTIRYIKEYGLANHLQHINSNKSNYILHLLGLVNYVLFINPSDKEALEQKKFLIDIYKGENLTL